MEAKWIFKDGVSTDLFYGHKTSNQLKEGEKDSNEVDTSWHKQYPSFMYNLLGPSKTWKVFKKQNDAINFCLQRKNGLMVFAFEEKGGQRLFLVAHPKVFWAENNERFFHDCNTYEIILEYVACKLYLDIEYEYEYNTTNYDGDRMVTNFLHIVNQNLKEQYGINCTSDNILKLDSSNKNKYSHHIIYQIPNFAFENNYSVGGFVHAICQELKCAYKFYEASGSENIIKVANKYGLKEGDIIEFFVHDRKGNIKLFIDEGVYTKNRHFRILGSTKLKNKTPLVISCKNEYVPQIKDLSDLNLFLDSLITYFSKDVTKLLPHGLIDKSKCISQSKWVRRCVDVQNLETSSPHSVIDKFVQNIVSPAGSIYRKYFFSSSSRIVYDIYGYRYCHNIKRHHKSNNIMIVVDIQQKAFYQKCHDPDCSDFKSDAIKLPDEIIFYLQDDTDFPETENMEMN